MSDANHRTQIAMIEEAVKSAIEEAGEYVATQPDGADKSWGGKEFRIAETAARAAIAALRQAEAGKMSDARTTEIGRSP